MRSSTTASTRRWPGHCDLIEVTLFKDGSLQVTDNGRGMPVDIHPEGKGQRRGADPHAPACGRQVHRHQLQFSGGLHGVGVSVVNALSKQLDCRVRRGGKEYNIGFRAASWPRS